MERKSPRDLRSPPAEAFGPRWFLGLSCPEPPSAFGREPGSPTVCSPRGAHPPSSPSDIAVRPRGRPTIPVDLLEPRGLPAVRATDPRWVVLRRPGGSLGPASRPSPASEAPFRLSDLAASLPVRCLRCAWILRLALPPSVGAPGASSGLSSRPLGPLGAMRNVSAAPGTVNPAFPQVSRYICRSRVRNKE
jgi:hypothetical protein